MNKKPESIGFTPNEDQPSAHDFAVELHNEELLIAQARLNSLLKEYAELFDLSPVCYFILNKDGIIQKANERSCYELGLERNYIIGKPLSLFIRGESAQDDFFHHRNAVLRSGKTQFIEGDIQRVDGTFFSAIIKSSIVYDEHNRFKHLLTIINDISEIKQHEHHVEKALAKAQELNEMKSRFISLASHEFRTPLSAVLSSTSLIQKYLQTGEADKMNRHLLRIKSSVKNLTTTLDEFLSIEKLESGKVEVSRVKFNILDFCKDLIEDVVSIERKGQQISYSHNGDKEIVEDNKIIQHILLNLLSNACKYSGEDSVIFLSTEVNSRQVSIKVKDCGIGIPEAEQVKLFTRFFRAHNALNIEGTGLGLNIVKRYVELLNGTIDFTSHVNIGTTFSVDLPRIVAIKG